MATKKEKLIYLERKQPTDYVANYRDLNGNVVTYTWRGARANRPSIVGVPEEVYQYFRDDTMIFVKGRLVIAEQPNKEEIKEDLSYTMGVEELPEILSIKELADILALPVKTFKTKLDTLNIANVEALIDYAKDVKLDSDSKKTALAKKIGADKDLVFPTQE